MTLLEKVRVSIAEHYLNVLEYGVQGMKWGVTKGGGGLGSKEVERNVRAAGRGGRYTQARQDFYRQLSGTAKMGLKAAKTSQGRRILKVVARIAKLRGKRGESDKGYSFIKPSQRSSKGWYRGGA